MIDRNHAYLDLLNTFVDEKVSTRCNNDYPRSKADFFKNTYKTNDKAEWVNFTEKEVDYDTQVKPKITEIKKTQAMRLIRNRRWQLLKESDWMANQDRTMTDAEKEYRQKLRDMPADNPNATLDSNDAVTNVTWPTKP